MLHGEFLVEVVILIPETLYAIDERSQQHHLADAPLQGTLDLSLALAAIEQGEDDERTHQYIIWYVVGTVLLVDDKERQPTPHDVDNVGLIEHVVVIEQREESDAQQGYRRCCQPLGTVHIVESPRQDSAKQR